VESIFKLGKEITSVFGEEEIGDLHHRTFKSRLHQKTFMLREEAKTGGQKNIKGMSKDD